MRAHMHPLRERPGHNSQHAAQRCDGFNWRPNSTPQWSSATRAGGSHPLPQSPKHSSIVTLTKNMVSHDGDATCRFSYWLRIDSSKATSGHVWLNNRHALKFLRILTDAAASRLFIAIHSRS